MLAREKWHFAFWWLIERFLRGLRLALNYAMVPIVFWLAVPHDGQFVSKFLIVSAISIASGALTDVLKKMRAVEARLEQVARELDQLKWRAK